MLTMTYGTMPTREQFDEGFDEAVVNASSGDMANGLFSFGNDPRVGTCRLNQEQLWEELNQAYIDYRATSDEQEEEEAGNWISCVLSCLGIEWV